MKTILNVNVTFESYWDTDSEGTPVLKHNLLEITTYDN